MLLFCIAYVVKFYSSWGGCVVLLFVELLFPMLFWGVNHTCPRECRSRGGPLSLSCKGMWLQLGEYCPNWVVNPAGLLNKIQFPLSWMQSKISISLSLSVLILLTARIMLSLFPLLWCFLLTFAGFYFLCEFALFCNFSTLLPLFLKTSISLSQNKSLKIAGLCLCCIWQV